jgi:hypothetical protein
MALGLVSLAFQLFALSRRRAHARAHRVDAE